MTYGRRTSSAKVYNAFGPKSTHGEGVRVSITLAEELELSKGDEITLMIPQ